MIRPRSSGQMLALCLPGLIALVPALQGRVRRPEPGGAAPARSAMVWHKEVGQHRQSVDAPMVVQVRSLIERAFALQAPNLDAHRRARAILTERYGAHVTETMAPPHYVWWWDPVLEQWILVCLSSSTFEIDFGRRGTVVVETTEEMPID